MQMVMLNTKLYGEERVTKGEPQIYGSPQFKVITRPFFNTRSGSIVLWLDEYFVMLKSWQPTHFVRLIGHKVSSTVVIVPVDSPGYYLYV